MHAAAHQFFSAQHRETDVRAGTPAPQRSPETITAAFGGDEVDASHDSKPGRGTFSRKGPLPNIQPVYSSRPSARLRGRPPTALHFEGRGKAQASFVAIPIFGTQSHALAGQIPQAPDLPAVKVEVGHEAEGGHIAGIAEQRLMQMLAGLIRFAEPQGETGKCGTGAGSVSRAAADSNRARASSSRSQPRRAAQAGSGHTDARATAGCR